MPQPQRIYRWTLLFWCVATVAHLVWFVVEAQARAPSDEVYAQRFEFLLAAFAATCLPWWLSGLLVVLVSEFSIFGGAQRGSTAKAFKAPSVSDAADSASNHAGR